MISVRRQDIDIVGYNQRNGINVDVAIPGDINIIIILCNPQKRMYSAQNKQQQKIKIKQNMYKSYVLNSI